MVLVDICTYCHLPISTRGIHRYVAGTVHRFCCYGCFLVYRITEREGEASSWLLARLGIGTFLTMGTMILSWLLSENAPSQMRPEVVFLMRWGTWALATPVMILLGYPLLKQGVVALQNRSVSLEGGIGLACAVIYGLSFANLCRGRYDIHFDTVCGTALLVTLGTILEATSKSAASRDIREFLGRDKVPAFRVEGDEVGRTSAAALVPGDIVRVPCGYTVPADGHILEGESRVRLTPLTGEREPVLRQEGDEILEGGKVIDNPLTVQVARTGRQTILSNLLSRIDAAVLVPSKTRRAVDRVVALFGPFIAVAAVCTLILWWPRNHTAAWFNFLSVMVIAYPCGLVLTTPLATTLAIARAAREGVLLAEAAVVENLSGISACFFDETDSFRETSRNSRLGKDLQSRRLDSRRGHGGATVATVVAASTGVTEHSAVPGIQARPMRFIELCTKLHERGLRTILLRGPSLDSDESDSRSSVVDGVYVGISAGEKQRLIQSYRNAGHEVALISSDAVNLKELSGANLHVAVGAECGDTIPDSAVTFMGKDLERLPWLIDLSRRVWRTVNWNLTWCFFYSVVGMVAAAAGILDPVFAAAAMLVSGTLVAGNTAQIHNYSGPGEATRRV